MLQSRDSVMEAVLGYSWQSIQSIVKLFCALYTFFKFHLHFKYLELVCNYKRIFCIEGGCCIEVLLKTLLQQNNLNYVVLLVPIRLFSNRRVLAPIAIAFFM